MTLAVPAPTLAQDGKPGPRFKADKPITVTCGPYHNVLRHLVPLVITDEELDEGLDVLGEAALRASRNGTPRITVAEKIWGE